jgi:predicted enzyme related to lactoylglutathione lyase
MSKNMKAFSSFSVDNIKKAKDFYSSKLGVAVSKTSDGALKLKTAGNEIYVYSKPNHKPATFTVLNFQVADINKAVDKLAKAGVKFEHYTGSIKTDRKGIAWGASMGRGPNIAWFKDPAGNILSVIEMRKSK